MSPHRSTPLAAYRADLERGRIVHDPRQEEAVAHTQRLYDQLCAEVMRERGFLRRVGRRLLGTPPAVIRGLYLWGGVGRGKTYLVDAFFESLPFEQKLRMHFHRFMQRVHGDLKRLHDVEDPLQRVADRFAGQARVICFDEFHVTDITDAMLLGNLLAALFERGVILVATSNEHPDELYRGGLQRGRFLPAIDLIHQHTRVVHLDSGVDYRLRYLDSAEIYHTPLGEGAEEKLALNFENLAPNAGRADRTIEIENRKIRTIRCADGVVWFDFPAICDGPRGPADYIEIARQFQTVLIGNIPQLHEEQNDMAKRFITLVDEFYDRHVKLILSAAVGITALYTGSRHAAAFRRTASRLQEMQSREYLARQHLPE